MEARPSEEKTESVEERGKKTLMKETTELLAELNAMPVEVLVKIFNFLPNHDIRCGVSLVCQKFYKICQDESLVPVKDLCIYGRPVGRKSKKKRQKVQQCYSLMNIGAVSDAIIQSNNLTFLKIKALKPEIVNKLVSIALQYCPKLTHLEIIETPKQLGEYFECKMKYVCSKEVYIYSYDFKLQI